MPHTAPKLHNAMWPGLVGKEEGTDNPPISLDRMLELTASAEVNGQKFDGIDYFLFLPHTDPDAGDDEIRAIADRIAGYGFTVGSLVAPVWPGTVVLQTPYGIVESPFTAVGKDHKVVGGKVVSGKVGHDRIQQGSASRSIGEEIRYWYGLKGNIDFETITIEVEIHADGHFILVPTEVQMRGTKRAQTLEKIHAPLSLNRDYQSKFWREEIERRRTKFRSEMTWAASQLRRIVDDHLDKDAANIHESDLLRTAGALSHLGVELGAHLGVGYDCPRSSFRFGSLPIYNCPIELKKQSRGFSYQASKYARLPRVVVLCVEHNIVNLPSHVDVIELPALSDYLDN